MSIMRFKETCARNAARKWSIIGIIRPARVATLTIGLALIWIYGVWPFLIEKTPVWWAFATSVFFARVYGGNRSGWIVVFASVPWLFEAVPPCVGLSSLTLASMHFLILCAIAAAQPVAPPNFPLSGFKLPPRKPCGGRKVNPFRDRAQEEIVAIH